MHVTALVWAVTLAAIVVIFAVDLLIVGRRPHEPSMRETAIRVGVYVTLAVIFSTVLLAAYGPRYGGEFFAGWLTRVQPVSRQPVRLRASWHGSRSRGCSSRRCSSSA